MRRKASGSVPSMGETDAAPMDLRRAYLVLAVVGLTGFQTSMALSIIFVAYPDIRRAFPNSSPVTLSWVLSVFSIVGAPTMVLGSAFSERVGRKRAMLLGIAGFTAASGLAALAPNPLLIIGARGFMLGRGAGRCHGKSGARMNEHRFLAQIGTSSPHDFVPHDSV